MLVCFLPLDIYYYLVSVMTNILELEKYGNVELKLFRNV